MSIVSLYQYFPSKDALVVALDLRHLDAAEERLRSELLVLRHDEPGPDEWATRIVDVLVAINESDLDRLLYRLAPPVPEVERRVDELVRLVVRDTQVHFERFGASPAVARLRARMAAITALTLVHEVGSRPPEGRRAGAAEEVARLLERLASL